MEQQEHQQCTSLQPLSVNQRVLVKNPITKSWDDRESSPKCDHLVDLMKCLWTLVKQFYRTELSFVLSLLIINPWKLHYPWQLHQNSHLPTFADQNASLQENNEADVNPSSPPGGIVGFFKALVSAVLAKSINRPAFSNFRSLFF